MRALFILSLVAAAVPAGVRERYSVVGVAADDTLNLRRAPEASAEIVAQIPPDATGLVSTGEIQRTGATLWRRVVYDGKRGWVSARFLRKEALAADTWKPDEVFYEPLSCVGDEPLWMIKVARDGQTAVQGDGLCEGATNLRAKRAEPGKRPNSYRMEVAGADGRACVTLQIRRTGRCRNDADQPEDYELVAQGATGAVSKGCCNPLRAEP